MFRSVGGEIRQSWCGPCFGQGPDALTPGQRAITSFNRNWQNRMGFGGEGYLASPAVVAASALVGYMAPPTELGLEWDAEEYGVLTRERFDRTQSTRLLDWSLDGLADRPADLDRARDPDVPRNRPRRRQHHLHLDPVGQAARRISSRARGGSACSGRW